MQLCREKEKARRVAKGRTRVCPIPSFDVSLSKWSQMMLSVKIVVTRSEEDKAEQRGRELARQKK